MSGSDENALNAVEFGKLVEAEKARIDRRRAHLYLTRAEKDEFGASKEKLAAVKGRQVKEIDARRDRLSRLKVVAAKLKRRRLFAPFSRPMRARCQRIAAKVRIKAQKLIADQEQVDQLESDESRLDRDLEARQQEVVASRRLTGLSLSGGGIRSACFNLGLLEGLDRTPYPQQRGAGGNSDPASDRPDDCRYLELFDYVSSVSGGSYAAGHLATAMLPPNLVADPSELSPGSAWLGNLVLTSKTVPGWLWGIGVWFLGVAFQLLKTGSLLLGFLALVAFVLRVLDSPDASRFCDALGFHSDLSRGFVPFWFALGIFLVACWINDSRWRKWGTVGWLGYALMVISSYVAVIWWFHNDPPVKARPLSFWVHYGFLMALPVPVVVVCVAILAIRGAQGFWWFLVGMKRMTPSPTVDKGHNPSRAESSGIRLRTIRLFPILVALFCVAGLVTTGDIDLNPPTHSSTQLLKAQELSRDLAEKQEWIAKAALSALGITSLAFFFPRNLFKSARKVEDHAVGMTAAAAKSWGRGWEPVFRVIVFLCSYGFILLVIFVLYGTVARENVSGYYEWREDLPFAAFHRTEFRDPAQAWERIARDAAAPKSGWQKLAARMMKAREQAGATIERERVVAAEIRALNSMPWVARLVPFLMNLGPVVPWTFDRFRIDPVSSRAYNARREQEVIEEQIAEQIAIGVLGDRYLYRDLPVFEDASPPETAEKLGPADYRALWDKYLEKGKSLATLLPADPAIQAAIRNNNRRALQLYLPDLMRDRVHENVVFASIVWAQDQWTRLWIALIAGGLWLLCCAVDVNSFSLQKFYRGHVIDSWVQIPQGKHIKRWLYETSDRYRGDDHREDQANEPSRPPTRRAPLLLINATLEGNRSLGDEPDLRDHIFTFSPVASGSGSTGYWLNGADPRRSLARRSHLDIGNIVATSGAFLSPGNVANPALSAILHLLNIQIGYWVHDPKNFTTRPLGESLRFHVCQSRGVDLEGDSRFMLTDGAHVENLGLYALLQRRCSLIIASDCSQEDRNDKAVRRFDALVHVLQQAEVDGIEVGPFLNSRAYLHWLKTDKIVQDEVNQTDCRVARAKGLDLVRPPDPPPDLAKGAPVGSPNPAPAPNDKSLSAAGQDAVAAGADFAREHYVFAQIVYPDKSRGLLVYLRPTLTGDEGDSLLHGAADSRFPDDDPMDQFYTPSKMSTYRLLGRHTVSELVNDPVVQLALGRIVQGQAATDEPSYQDQPDPRPDCDPRCVGSRPPCLLNRQRTFQRSSQATAANHSHQAGPNGEANARDAKPTPPPTSGQHVNGADPSTGPGSSPPKRRRRRRWRASGRRRAFREGPR